ncbi:Y4yA family PLP-dependent enzyme [Rubripirellula amarantea]|nr:Y4yA family PLP-dependent enzyme [Rubripirellula amarantea]
MEQLLRHPRLPELVAEHGSPLNVISSNPMRDNVQELNEIAASRGLDFRVFFARKSNKCLHFVDTANALNIGVDVASENELRQSFDRGTDSSSLICTAAIKDESLLRLCLDKNVCVAIDNRDELEVTSELARAGGHTAKIALRLGGFVHQGRKLPTRFGFDVERDIDLASQLSDYPVRVEGIHFHLDGYDADQRVSGIVAAMDWVKALRTHGHLPTFIDMGGGFPISYLNDGENWERFWDELRTALRGQRQPLTYRGHGLGLVNFKDNVIGKPNSYPYFQSLTRADWLKKILDTRINGETISKLLKDSNLQLRCEPGRSLMDGCGLTLARVEYRKQNADGESLVGLSMNRTQCRTSSDDFLVDPILIPSGGKRDPITGYLVGSYCTESELLTLRKLHFPSGVRRGDLVAFPNTAGYLMHFLESRSHQFPLAENLTFEQCTEYFSR